MALGTVFVELDLSLDKWNRSTQAVLGKAKSASEFMEANWRTLGSKSDIIFQAMANGAILAYEKITRRAKLSADEQFRAQSAMVHKINTINKQMVDNPLYKELGIKSQAMFKAQEKAIIKSYNTIKNSGRASARDLVNIEKAKNRKLKELNQEMVGAHRMSMASMTRAVLRLYAAYFVVSNVISVVVRKSLEMTKVIFEAGMAVEQTRKAFTEITGSVAAAGEEFDFLRGVADRLGQNFWNLLPVYKGILAASRGTALEGAKVRDVFESVTRAAATLGLSADKTKLVLYAVEQMMSKGKITSEELRRQLGDSLAGAFSLAAKAIGKNTAELDKMMKAGKLISSDFLPKFAAVLKERYSGEVVAAVRATNKWNEAIQDLKITIADSGFLEKATKILEDLTKIIKDPQFQADATDFANAIIEIAGKLAVLTTKLVSFRDEFLKVWALSKLIFAGQTGVGFIEQFKVILELLKDPVLTAPIIKQKIYGQYPTERPPDEPLFDDAAALKTTNVKLRLLKKAYNTEMDMVNHLAKMKRIAGEEELLFAKEIVNQKIKAVEVWHKAASEAVTSNIQDETVRKDKLALLHAEYVQKYIALLNEREEAEFSLEQKLFDLRTNQLNTAISQMSKMFSEIGSMYDKASGQYKAMQRMVEIMTIAEKGLAVAKAVSAILNQAGGGDPYTAFARMATMAAAVASLLASIGTSLGGGGFGGPSVGAPSTVFGGALGEGSESVSNSLDLLESIYDLQYYTLTGIHNGIKDLNANIENMVGGVIGITGGEGGGTSLIGSIVSSYKAFVSGIDVLKDSLRDSMMPIAAALGVGPGAVTGYKFGTSGFDFGAAGTLSEAAAAELSRLADLMAMEIFGELITSYRKLGEGAFETATRLAVDVTVITDTLDKLGATFSNFIPDAISLSEALIYFAGGLDELVQISDVYYNKFFTDAEKQLDIQEDLTAIMEAFNLTLPETREGYRLIVEAMDLTTESGQEAYVTLLAAAGMADQYYELIADSEDKRVKQAKNTNNILQKLIDDMTFGGLAPTDNFAAQQAQLGAFFKTLITSTDLGIIEKTATNLSSFLPGFLKYATDYGLDYNQVVSSIMPILDAAMEKVGVLGGLEPSDVMGQAADTMLDAAETFSEGVDTLFPSPGGKVMGGGGNLSTEIVDGIVSGLGSIMYEIAGPDGTTTPIEVKVILGDKSIGDAVSRETIINRDMVMSIDRALPEHQGRFNP